MAAHGFGKAGEQDRNLQRAPCATSPTAEAVLPLSMIKDQEKRRAIVRAATRKHYRNNKAQYAARNAVKRVEKSAFIRAAREVPCVDCGGKFPFYCMEFDHRDPSVKVHNIAGMRNLGWATIKAEIAKCDVVCANCHSARTYFRRSGEIGKHASLRNWSPAGSSPASDTILPV